ISVVPVILIAENRLEESRVRAWTAAGRRFQRFDVCKSAQAARDIARRQRLALQSRDDAYHVNHLAAFRRTRGNPGDLQLLLFQSEGCVGELPFLASQRAEIGGNGYAEHLRLGDDQECRRVDWSKRARGQHGPLHTLLAVFFDEDVEVGKVTELWFVHSRLRADRKWLSNLRNDHADLSRGHLYPRVFRHCVYQPKLEAQA